VAGIALGAVATTVALDRMTVSRSLRRQARLALDAAGPYGTLRGTPGTAVADDGTELYFEVDEPGPDAVPVAAGDRVGRPARRALRPREAPAPPTVVFSHGYCLGQDVWHFQRAALRGAVRAVYWDQRGHGRSERGRSQREAGRAVSIDQLGRDLRAVLDAAAPEGPVVLVGHSMGGMTVMALVEQYPEYVARRVAGVGFLGTSAGGLNDLTYGLSAPAARVVRRVLPGVIRALGSQATLVDAGRRVAGDLYAGLMRRLSFGDPERVDPGVARFAERLIESVPMDVVADFYPAFAQHEKTGALSVLHGLAADLPVLVLAAGRDEMTPAAHSERIGVALPRAETVLLPDAGHLMLLEEPARVNEALGRLLARSIHTHERPV
jgi:pimeloyl-ACP methyl ester carboxylesterase